MQKKVEEGFRVLTLEKEVDEEVIEFIRRYQALATHLYWAKRLGIQPSGSVVQEVNESIRSYWRWHIIDEKDPMYLLKGIERTPRPSRALLKLPLVDALHYKKGGYLKDGKLVLRLNKVVEIDVSDRAWEWLSKRLAEGPDRKTVRVFERGGKLVAQVVLHKRAEVQAPRDPLLVVIDINSSHGVVVHYWDGKLIKTEKYRPPNRGARWVSARRLMEVRDNLYNQGCIAQAQVNKFSALIRDTLGGSARGWAQQAADRIVTRIRRIARRHGKEPLVLIDVPGDESLRGTSLQRTLLSFTKYLENLLSWYGVYWEERRLYSTVCPVCGGKLKLKRATKRARIMECPRCGFSEERDAIPLYWAIKLMPRP